MVNRKAPVGSHKRHFGFCVDLLKKLAAMAKFDLEIEAIEGGRYGTFNHSTGEWDGLVQMVMKKVG